MVLVFHVIHDHGYAGMVLATLIAGLLLVIAGYARLGAVIKFVPQPVVAGFTMGIAVSIITTQFQYFLGLDIADLPGDVPHRWQGYWQSLPSLSWPTLIIGLIALATILGLRLYRPRWPGALIAIAVTALIVGIAGLPVATIGSVYPDLPAGLPSPAWPQFSFGMLRDVLPSAFAIAFLAGVEALLSAVVADGMTGYRHNSNQELVGQGIANMACALFGGLPATGALARTATNIRAGATTPIAGIVHALLLMGIFTLAMPVMGYVPLACLAAILFIVAWSMAELDRFGLQMRAPAGDRTTLLLTLFLTVFVDLTVAIAVGVGLACLLFMVRMADAVEITTGASPLRSAGEEEMKGQRTDLPDGVEVYQISGPFFFGVANELLDSLARIRQWPKTLILRLEQVPLIDASGAAALEQFILRCKRRGTAVVLAGVQAQPNSVLVRLGMGPGSGFVRYAADFDAAMRLVRTLAAGEERFD